MNEHETTKSFRLVDRIARAAAIIAIIVMVLAFAADLYVSRTTPKPIPPTPSPTVTRKPSPTFTVTTTPYFQQRLNEPPIDNLLPEDLINPLIERDFSCSGYELNEDQYYESQCTNKLDDVSYQLMVNGLNENRVDFIEASISFDSTPNQQAISDFFIFIAIIPQIVMINAQQTAVPTLALTLTPQPDQILETTESPLQSSLPTPISTLLAETSDSVIDYLKQQIETAIFETDFADRPVALEVNGIYYQLTTSGEEHLLSIGIPIVQ